MPRESADGDDGEPVARSGVGLSEEIDCCLPCVAGKEGDRAATTPRAPTPPTPCPDREQQLLLRAVPPASDQQQCEPKQEPEGPELGRLAAAFYSTPAAAASAAAAAAMTAAAADAAAKERARILANGGTDPVAPNGTLTRSNSSLAQREAHTTAGGTVVSVEEHMGGARAPHAERDTFWPCTFNLCKVIMGAGMMAVPRALSLLGLLPGLTLMTLMAGLTYWTLSQLVAASETAGARDSYGGLVRRTVGRGAERVLQIAVLANCAVMNVVFVVVLGDILLGSAPNYAGVLPEAVRAAAAAGWLPPGVPTSPSDPWGWLLGRPAVLGVVSLCILLPLSLARSMSALAPVNIIGVASNAGFAALLLSLAGAAVAAGTAAPLDLLPDWAALLPAGTSGSSGGAAGVAAAAVALAGVAPVLLNVDVCHQSLHPLMPLLQPYSPRRMRRLVATALALCNLVYLAIGLSAWAVFGELLDPDVLSNVNSAALAPMIGAGAAAAAAGAVRVGYLASIVGSFVLLTHPLRQCIGDLLLGGQRAVAAHWQVMTLVLVGGAYAVGCFVPTIWSALALVGATTSTVQAFIVPGLVVLAAQRPRRGRSSGSSSAEPLLLSAALPGSGVSRGPAAKAGAMLVIALGVALFINSVVDALRGGAASSGGRAAAASGADGGAIGGVSGADLLWATLGLAR